MKFIGQSHIFTFLPFFFFFQGSSILYRKIVLDELEVLTGKGNFSELEEILNFIGTSLFVSLARNH